MAEEALPHVAAFQAEFDNMVDTIDAESLAPAAFSEGIINDRQRDELRDEKGSYKKAEFLLGKIKKKITNKSDADFLKFVNILRRKDHSTQADQLGEMSLQHTSTYS